MKIAILLYISLISRALLAQEAQSEINSQVWKPFIKAFNEFNTTDFMSVHSNDLVRSPRDSKIILTWKNYFEELKKSDDQAKANGRKRTIELRFTERIHTGENAIDVGIYKTTSINNNAQSAFYGRFLVVLRKESGVWKILVDTDSSEGKTIGEKDFAAAKSIE
jgi:hypothetical protein